MFNKKGVAIMTLIVIGLIAGALALGGFALWANGTPQDIQITYAESSTTLIPSGLEEQAIVFNNITLFDSTEFDEQSNTCTATRHGMQIKIYPCVANDVDARDIQHVVNFTWNGGAPQRTDWIFVYEGQLENGRMDAWMNTSRIRQETVNGLQWINNFPVGGVQGSVNLGSPDTRCQIGSINNTQMYNVTRNTNSTTISKVYCFTNVTVQNSSSYLISGNIDTNNVVNVTYFEPHWNDVTSNIEYMGFGLLQDNRSYYKVSNVTFQPGQTISTLWQYTPFNRTERGKWHILGYDGNVGLVNSIVGDAYIYVDPWWNSAVPYRRVLNFTTVDAIGLNYTHRVRIPYQAEFGSACVNMYVLYKDATEIDADYRVCNSTTVELGFRNQMALPANTFDNNYSIYYGASAGAHKTNRNIVYVWNDDFDASNSSKYGTFSNPGTIAGGVNTITANLRSDVKGNIVYSKNFTLEFQANIAGNIVPGQVYIGMLNGQPWAGATPFAVMASGNEQRRLGKNDGSGAEAGTTVIGGYTAGLFNYSITLVNQTALRGTNSSLSLDSPAGYTGLTLNTATGMGAGWTTADNSGSTVIDFIRLMEDVNARPAYNLGAEEQEAGVAVVANSPVDNFVTPYSTLNVTANVSRSGSTLIANATARIYNSSDALVQSIFNNTISGMIQANVTFPVSALAQGNYKWAVEVRGDLNEVASTANRTFIIDQTNPIINLTILDRYPVTDTFPTNISFFLNASDAQLQSCFYEFQGVNTTAPNCNGLINVSVSNFGFYTIRGYANDSVGNFAVNTSNASVIYYNVTQSTPLVAEGGYSVFNLTVNMTNIPSITTLLRYNNTGYSPTTQTTSQNGSFSSVTLNIPAGLGNSTGVPQFWNWSVNLTGATNFTTRTYQQTVLGVVFSNCSAGGVLVYNFTQYDEGTRNLINFSAGNNLQVDLTARSLIDSSISFRYNNTVTNAPSLLVCLPSGVLNSTSYRVDLTGSYVATGYVQEFFYIDNGTLSLPTVPNNFAWYDLDLDDSTTFLFTFLDENGIETPGVIVETLRKYIGAGLLLDVERSKEDNNGETHIHLVEEDVIYRFNITLNNQQIFLSEEYNAKCLSSPCSITLSAEPETEPFPTVYNNLPEGSYRVTANSNTREVTLFFNLNQTGTMNLTVFTNNNNEVEAVASGTTTASAGQVVVTVPLQYGNATYSAVIYMNDDFVASRVVDLTEDANDYFGTLGLFLAGLAVLCLALIGASHGEWVIVWTVLGMITVSMLVLVDLEWYALLTFVAGAGIFLIKLVSRRRVS